MRASDVACLEGRRSDLSDRSPAVPETARHERQRPHAMSDSHRAARQVDGPTLAMTHSASLGSRQSVARMRWPRCIACARTDNQPPQPVHQQPQVDATLARTAHTRREIATAALHPAKTPTHIAKKIISQKKQFPRGLSRLMPKRRQSAVTEAAVFCTASKNFDRCSIAHVSRHGIAARVREAHDVSDVSVSCVRDVSGLDPLRASRNPTTVSDVSGLTCHRCMRFRPRLCIRQNIGETNYCATSW